MRRFLPTFSSLSQLGHPTFFQNMKLSLFTLHSLGSEYNLQKKDVKSIFAARFFLSQICQEFSIHMAGKVQKSAVVEFKEEAVYWSSTVLWVAGNSHVNRNRLLPFIIWRVLRTVLRKVKIDCNKMKVPPACYWSYIHKLGGKRYSGQSYIEFVSVAKYMIKYEKA